jgi:hypothetical protein
MTGLCTRSRALSRTHAFCNLVFAGMKEEMMFEKVKGLRSFGSAYATCWQRRGQRRLLIPPVAQFCKCMRLNALIAGEPCARADYLPVLAAQASVQAHLSLGIADKSLLLFGNQRSSTNMAVT